MQHRSSQPNKLVALQVDDHIGEMTVRETFDFSVRHFLDELYACRPQRYGPSSCRCPCVAPCLSYHCKCLPAAEARLALLRDSVWPVLITLFMCAQARCQGVANKAGALALPAHMPFIGFV